MLRADQLAAVSVAVLGGLRVLLHGLSACGEQAVRLVPHLLGNDGRHAVVLVDDPLVLVQTVAALVAVVACRVAPPGVAALVFRVAYHAVECGVGEGASLPSAHAAAFEVVCDGAQTERTGGVALEHLADNGGLALDDFQPSVRLVVAEQVVLPEQDAVLLRSLEAETGPFGQLAHLVLRDGGHDGEAQLGVPVEGVDVVVLKEHADAVPQQLARVADAVEGVAGEAADLLGHNEVEPPGFGVLNHAEKLLASLDRGAADALVHVAAGKGPVRIGADIVLKVADLIAEAVDLLLLVGRNAGVVGHGKRGVKDAAALCLHFVQSADIHGGRLS